jgi:hypothetical protein
MEENGSKKKIPPKWWANVISDIERSISAARTSIHHPNIILGTEAEDIDEPQKITGYLIRMPGGKVGFYSAETIKRSLKIKRDIPVGIKIPIPLPEPDELRDEPKIEAYVFEGIRENVKLIPKLWLRRIIIKIVNGKPITIKEDLIPFPKWVLLPFDKREDKALIDVLYRATRYEGVRGLARFNDILDPQTKIY